MNLSPTDMGLLNASTVQFTGELHSPELDALRKHADALANAGAEVINKPQSHSARAALATAVADYTAWQIDGVA